MQASSITFPSLEDTLKEFSDLRKYEDQTDELVEYDFVPANDPDRQVVKEKIEKLSFENLKESKAFACFVASAVGDALGAHLEGQPVDYTRDIIKDFKSLEDIKHNKARPPSGLYTDDTSLALCVADSILKYGFKFNGVDLRHRFMLWWFKGYNNGRAKDPKDRKSFGIGSTTMNSFFAFGKRQMEFVPMVYKYIDENNANGSIMRIAPVPIAFHDNLEQALDYAEKQSRTTHNGTEASEVCKLVTFLIIKFFECETTEQCREILNELPELYRSENDAVQALVRSQQETDYSTYEGSKHDQGLEDRNWNWKADEYRYSPYRMERQKDYTGIYCMDCVAMSLHILYHTKSLKEALLRAVNLGGDCDSVGAVTGALAGAMYGFDEFLRDCYEHVKNWDEMKVAIRAYKLFHKKAISVLDTKSEKRVFVE